MLTKFWVPKQKSLLPLTPTFVLLLMGLMNILSASPLLYLHITSNQKGSMVFCTQDFLGFWKVTIILKQNKAKIDLWEIEGLVFRHSLVTIQILTRMYFSYMSFLCRDPYIAFFYFFEESGTKIVMQQVYEQDKLMVSHNMGSQVPWKEIPVG